MASAYTILTCHDPGIQYERPENIFCPVFIRNSHNDAVSKCSSSRTSRRLLTNIAPAQLRFGEDITPLALTLAEQVLTFA